MVTGLPYAHCSNLSSANTTASISILTLRISVFGFWWSAAWNSHRLAFYSSAAPKSFSTGLTLNCWLSSGCCCGHRFDSLEGCIMFVVPFPLILFAREVSVTSLSFGINSARY